MYVKLYPSMEAIKHQDGKFFEALTSDITELLSNNANPFKLNQADFNPLCETIFKYTGLSVVIYYSDEGPAVLVPDMSTITGIRNVSTDESFVTAKISKLFLNAKNESELRGKVDLENGKVYGIFSEVKSMLFLNPYILNATNITPDLHAAYILHELGHLMSYFECIDRAFTTNWALREIANSYRADSDIKEREIILKNIKDTTKYDAINTKDLAKTTDPTVVGTVIVNAAFEKSKSEIGMNIYDTTNWEYLSDQYAIRNGAGKQVIQFLDITSFRRYRESHAFVEVCKLVTFGLAVASASLSVTLTTGLALIGLVITGVFVDLFNIDRSKRRLVYDREENRFLRARLQIVDRLKNSKLPIEVRNKARADLKYIDEVIKISEDRLTIVNYLVMKLFGFDKERFNQEKIQIELEKLAMNDLYVRAFDLKQLT